MFLKGLINKLKVSNWSEVFHWFLMLGVLFLIFFLFNNQAYALNLDLNIAKINLNEKGLSLNTVGNPIKVEVKKANDNVKTDELAGNIKSDELQSTNFINSQSLTFQTESDKNIIEKKELPAKDISNQMNDFSSQEENIPTPPNKKDVTSIDNTTLNRNLQGATNTIGGIVTQVTRPVSPVIEAINSTTENIPVAGKILKPVLNSTTNIVGTAPEIVNTTNNDLVIPVIKGVTKIPSDLLSNQKTNILSSLVNNIIPLVGSTLYGVTNVVSDLSNVIKSTDAETVIIPQPASELGFNSYDQKGFNLNTPKIIFERSDNQKSTSKDNSLVINYRRSTNNSDQIPANNSAHLVNCGIPINTTSLPSSNNNSSNGGAGQLAIIAGLFMLGIILFKGRLSDFVYPRYSSPFIQLFSPPG